MHEWIAQGYRDHGEEEPTAEPLEPPAVNRLREIKVPTLVIWGEKDPALPLTLAEGIARDIPQAKLVTIPDAGHFVPEERPERVAALLKEFLG